MSWTAGYFVAAVIAMVSVYPVERSLAMSQEPDSKQTQKTSRTNSL
jgi:hypothetical protein